MDKISQIDYAELYASNYQSNHTLVAISAKYFPAEAAKLSNEQCYFEEKM